MMKASIVVLSVAYLAVLYKNVSSENENTASEYPQSHVRNGSDYVFQPLPPPQGRHRLADYVDANEDDWDLGFHAVIAQRCTDELTEMDWGMHN